MDDVLTTMEAAQYLRLSTDTIKRLSRSGQVAAAKVGRQWRWRRKDLDEFLAMGGTRVRWVRDDGYVAECERRLQEGPRLTTEEMEAELGL